jgi:starvation-inducible DNA-binding protein
MAFTRIDLGPNVRKNMIGLLNQRLADAIDLAGQCKQAHWNVKGPQFIALHELFDTFYTNVTGHVDELAERITALGGTARGTTQTVAKATSLPEYDEEITSGEAHLKALGASLAAFGKSLRANIDDADKAGDKDTADLFTGISRAIDKDLWFVDAHLDKAK